MIRLHHIIILSVFSLLRCYSAWAQEKQPFETSIVPSEVEGQTLEVPRGQLRKIQFTVTYIPNGIMYRPGLQINGIRFNIEGHDLLNRRLLSIVRRSCDDSDKPGETCELLQVTVNGTNEQISELDDERLQFFVMGVGFSLVKTSESITLRIVDPPTTDEPVTTKPETTTQEPVATTKSTTGDPSIESQNRDQSCEPIRVETIVPWVFVAILAALLFLTIVILILVICRNRNRQDLRDKLDVEGRLPMPNRSDTNCNTHPTSTSPENCDTTSQGSSSKDSL